MRWIALLSLFFVRSLGAQGATSPNNIQVNCKPWSVLIEPRTIVDAENPESESETITFYSAGTVDGMAMDGHGQPRRAELVISKSHWRGIGKDGFDASDIDYRRYIKINKSFYYLALNSTASQDFRPGTEGENEIEVLASNGFTVNPPWVQEGKEKIPEFLCPKIIQGPEPWQNLEFVAEVEATMDLSKVRPAFVHLVLGQVYTTKSEVAENAPFFVSSQKNKNSTILHRLGSDLLTTNGFYVFRPDGTMLVYRAKPDWEGSKGWTDYYYNEIPDGDFVTSGGKPFGPDYSYQTKVGCLDKDYSNFCAVANESLFSERDLEPYGRITKTARVLFDIKDKNHPIYKEFYEAYRSNFAEWLHTGSGGYPRKGIPEKLTDHILSYDDFVATVPILLYKDSFGRWIRLSHRAFIPPAFCEPVIYLYPPKSTQVTVRVDPPGGVTESIPAYNGSWKALSHPDGQLEVSGYQKPLKYLFWEGHGPIFPMRPEGKVVARKDVNSYLDQILSEFGLSHLEISDFEKAWLPKLQRKPFCFITFYWGDFVDKLAPLNIEPKPDTVLRILMDYKPLEQRESVPELPAIPKLKRQGFTVVEWGGMER